MWDLSLTYAAVLWFVVVSLPSSYSTQQAIERTLAALAFITLLLYTSCQAIPTPAPISLHTRSSKIGFGQVFPSAPLPPPGGLDPVAPIPETARTAIQG